MFSKADASSLAAVPETEFGTSTVVAVKPSPRMADALNPQLPLQDLLFLHPQLFLHLEMKLQPCCGHIYTTCYNYNCTV
jgi:hypothetical protein